MTDLADVKNLTAANNFDVLLELRNKLGPVYGSEDLCVLLYSIIKREKPEIVVELGTGLGVTTAWIAAAMKENGRGKIYTFDNGKSFDFLLGKAVFENMTGPLAQLAECDTFDHFLETMFDVSGVSQFAKSCHAEFDLSDLSWLDKHLQQHTDGNTSPPIDILFSDYNHSASNTAKIIGTFLPRMSEVSSIFIDSASTNMTSYLMLEQLTQMFNSGRVPKELLEHLGEPESQAKLTSVVTSSTFRLMHLVERQVRAQNSTAWLRTEKASLLPALALCLH